MKAIETGLVPVYEKDGGGVAVDARELHGFLEVGRDFSNWIKDRIEKYGFDEGEDYILFDSPNLANQTGRGGDRKSKAYLLSMDCAKEIAMAENNERGRQVRRYFIECERRYKETHALTPAEQLLASVQLTVDMERRQREQQRQLTAIESRLDHVEARQVTKDTSFYTVSGYCSLRHRSVDRAEAIRLGKEAARLSRECGLMIGKEYDAKYGQINTYHIDVLTAVCEF